MTAQDNSPRSLSKSATSPPTTNNISDYTLGRKIGEGAYAVVHTALNKKT